MKRRELMRTLGVGVGAAVGLALGVRPAAAQETTMVVNLKLGENELLDAIVADYKNNGKVCQLIESERIPNKL